MFADSAFCAITLHKGVPNYLKLVPYYRKKSNITLTLYWVLSPPPLQRRLDPISGHDPP